MAVLSKHEILTYLTEGKLQFNPGIDQFQLQPHAVDLRIGYTFKLPIHWKMTPQGRHAMNIDYLEVDDPQAFEEITLDEGQYFEMLPQETVLAKTLEHVSLNSGDIMAILYPRSSLNRRGLALDLTGIVDSYYSGHLLIPIKNNTNQTIRLYPGERFCSLVIETLSSPLSSTLAKQHGVNPAKYENGATNFKKDEAEAQFLREGNLHGLKETFKLEIE